jgi:hypothetical protein
MSFFVFKTHLSNIQFQYGVFVSPAYSSPFSRLSYVHLSMTWQFASKSNCCCKLWVIIWFILFHNSSSLEFVVHYIILTTSTASTFNTFYHTPLNFELRNKIIRLNPLIYSITRKTIEKHIHYNNNLKNSPQDGHQMFKMKLIIVELLHVTLTTNFHLACNTFIIYA